MTCFSGRRSEMRRSWTHVENVAHEIEPVFGVDRDPYLGNGHLVE
jgi:hypothetical protein